ncbi:MAG: winged helix-turn-helix transcriptional regulator [Phycisphaerae bacterium]
MPCSGKKRPGGCPITHALDTFGDKWSLLVIRDLMLKGCEHYGDFLTSGEGIATNILADRLKHLEAAGVIRKRCDPENRKRYIYSLTEKGADLAPVIVELIRWSITHDPDTQAPKEFLQKIEEDRDGFMEELRSRLSER